MEPFDLYIDGHLSPFRTAKATHLAKLAPQLTIGALQQRSGADELTRHPFQRIVGNSLLKITLEGRNGFRGSCSPGVGKRGQTPACLLGTLSLVDRTALRHKELALLLLVRPFEFCPGFLV